MWSEKCLMFVLESFGVSVSGYRLISITCYTGCICLRPPEAFPRGLEPECALGKLVDQAGVVLCVMTWAERLGTLPIEFRWGVSFPLPKTGSLSDEPFRGCRDDAVLEGIASTGRLAPNRALSLCTEVKMTDVEFCAKFGRCSLSGLEVTAFLVFA